MTVFFSNSFEFFEPQRPRKQHTYIEKIFMTCVRAPGSIFILLGGLHEKKGANFVLRLARRFIVATILETSYKLSTDNENSTWK